MSLWNLDLAFADIAATSSDPRIGAIRLAWWRERLEQLDQAQSMPAEPRLAAVARELIPRGISGQDLSRLEDGWRPSLDPLPWSAAQVDGFQLRGQILFNAGAQLLGGNPEFAESAGALWSLIDAAQHCSDTVSRNVLVDAAKDVALPKKTPGSLRPMTILAALAISNVRDPSSAIARGMAAMHHRLTGRFARL